MKAPDKIYMLPEELEERSEWLTEPYEDRDIAYIRQDLLIEWMEQYEKRTRTAIIPLLVKDFIEKLNSL